MVMSVMSMDAIRVFFFLGRGRSFNVFSNYWRAKRGARECLAQDPI